MPTHQQDPAVPADHPGKHERSNDSTLDTVDHIFKTIRLMFTLFSSLFAVLLLAIGFVGWRTASGISDTVDQQLGSVISGHSDDTDKFSAQLASLKKRYNDANQSVDELTSDLSAAHDSLRLFLAGDADPVGDYLILLSRMDQTPDILLNSEARRQAELVFIELLNLHRDSVMEQDDPESDPLSSARYVEADILFNAAGTASSFLMPKLASDLAKAAWEKQDTPENKARMLRAMIATGEADEEHAFAEIFTLVEQLDTSYQVHLTLSEAFNIALSGGRLSSFATALDQLKERLGERAPSYIWILQANSRLLQGSNEDVRAAIEELREGLERASRESPMALWFEYSVELGDELLKALESHPEFQSVASEIRVEHSDVLSIKTSDAVSGDLWDAMIELLSEDEDDTLLPANIERVDIALDERRTVDNPRGMWFGFQADASGYYILRAVAGDTDVDPELAVYDSENAFLGYDDDGGGGFDSELRIWLSEGEYAIQVTSAIGDSVMGAEVTIERADQ